MVFPNKVDPDDSLPAAASRCLSHRCPFVQQLGTRGGIPRATAHSERAQWQGGGDRAFLAAVCLTQVVNKSQTARPEGHKDCGTADDS